MNTSYYLGQSSYLGRNNCIMESHLKLAGEPELKVIID